MIQPNHTGIIPINKQLIRIFLLSALFLTLLPIASSYTLTYDAANNTVQINYDSLNRISNKTTNLTNITYTYDADFDGTLANVTIGNITVKYEYDDRRRIVKETKVIDGIIFEKQVSYDSINRVIEKRLPSADLEYYYNKQGRVNKINNYTSSGYNAFGSLLNRTYNNNLITAFTYTPSNNRLNQIKTASLQQLNYSYDSLGNIKSIIDSVQNKDYSMGYDALDRLTNTTINTDLYQYEYDSIGNIKRIATPSGAKRLNYNGKMPHAPSEIVNNSPGAGAYSAKDLDTDNKNRTIEFFLVKETLSNQTNVNWSVDFGDNNKVNSTIPVNISTPIMVLVQNNYVNGGLYVVNISTSTDANLFKNKFGVNAKSLEFITNNKTLVSFNLTIENDISETATNVRWSCDNGNSSSSPFTIAGNTKQVINIESNYTSSGKKKILCNVTSNDGTGNKTISFKIKGLEIENYELFNKDINRKIAIFDLKNYYHPLSPNLSILSDSNNITQQFNISSDGFVMAIVELNYSTDGDKKVNITALSTNTTNSYLDNFNIQSLGIERYLIYNFNNTQRNISFVIYNYWPQNLSVNWNLTTDSVSQNSTYLAQNQSINITLLENYTTQGRKELIVTASSGSFLTSLKDGFNIHIIEVLDLQVLEELQNKTISEIVTKSSSGNKSISWNLDTGQQNITSTLPIYVNESNKVMILIEHNYTSSGVYVTNATINSSNYTDTAKGVAII